MLALAAAGTAELLVGCGSSSGRGAASGSTAAASSATVSSASTSSAPAPVLAQTGTYSGGALPASAPASMMSASTTPLDASLSVISGSLPADLEGHYFVIASAPPGNGTYVFGGDGVLHRVDLGGGQAAVKRRVLATPCYYADQATRGSLSGFTGLNRGPSRVSPKLGFRNLLNTALVPMGPDRLVAGYDAGRPFEVDPVSLRVVTPVGRHAEWQAAITIPTIPGLPAFGRVFPLVQASAHPAFDHRTGELFSACYGNVAPRVLGVTLGGKRFTQVVRWDGAGDLHAWDLVDGAGRAVELEMSAHQIHVTRDYVVIQDGAFEVETAKFLDRKALTVQQSETVLWIVNRGDLTGQGGQVTARRAAIPRESVHFVADYANPSGNLVVHLFHGCALDASEWLLDSDVRYDDGTPVRRDLEGLLCSPTDLSAIGRYVIDGASGQVRSGASTVVLDPDWMWGIGLYTHSGLQPQSDRDSLYVISGGILGETLPKRLADAYASYPHRTVPLNQLPLAQGVPAKLFRFAMDRSQVADGYSFPWGYQASSPHFAPRSSSRGPTDGYVICTVVSDDASWPGSSGDELWVFDAANLAQGPLCRLGHPDLDLPFTLHTAFLEQIQPRSAGYLVDVEADHQAEVSRLSSRLQGLFQREVYPHF
ncbi:MAG: carotenoid oxygenase family protein [Planctomycetes bacterium]|nr:carotenoid oxygenase family protein [Planctomycetota bacterium]